MAALKADVALPAPELKRRRYMNVALLIVDKLGFKVMTLEEANLFSG